MIAGSRGHTKTVKVLLKLGASVDIQDQVNININRKAPPSGNAMQHHFLHYLLPPALFAFGVGGSRWFCEDGSAPVT